MKVKAYSLPIHVIIDVVQSFGHFMLFACSLLFWQQTSKASSLFPLRDLFLALGCIVVSLVAIKIGWWILGIFYFTRKKQNENENCKVLKLSCSEVIISGIETCFSSNVFAFTLLTLSFVTNVMATLLSVLFIVYNWLNLMASVTSTVLLFFAVVHLPLTVFLIVMALREEFRKVNEENMSDSNQPLLSSSDQEQVYESYFDDIMFKTQLAKKQTEENKEETTITQH